MAALRRERQTSIRNGIAGDAPATTGRAQEDLTSLRRPASFRTRPWSFGATQRRPGRLGREGGFTQKPLPPDRPWRAGTHGCPRDAAMTQFPNPAAPPPDRETGNGHPFRG